MISTQSFYFIFYPILFLLFFYPIFFLLFLQPHRSSSGTAVGGLSCGGSRRRCERVRGYELLLLKCQVLQLGFDLINASFFFCLKYVVQQKPHLLQVKYAVFTEPQFLLLKDAVFTKNQRYYMLFILVRNYISYRSFGFQIMATFVVNLLTIFPIAKTTILTIYIEKHNKSKRIQLNAMSRTHRVHKILVYIYQQEMA